MVDGFQHGHAGAGRPRLVEAHGVEGGAVEVALQPRDVADLQVVAEHIASSFESYLGATVSQRTFGRATESLARTLLQWADPGAPTTSMPDHLAGFTLSSVPSPV